MIASAHDAELRAAQLSAELDNQLARADELAAQLRASRTRLTQARDVERHRLVSQLTQVSTDRLAALRTAVAAAQRQLCGNAAGAERALPALAQARSELDELLDRFRMIARGVYPTVLRAQGPAGALEELVAELPRPVLLSGTLSRRWAWEVESGIYWLAASALQQLARRPAQVPLRVHLEHTQGRLALRIDDPTLAGGAADVRAALAVDVDRLAALGGTVEITENGAGGLALRAWLPDQLQPPVALWRITSTDAPDLAGLAEAIAHQLGARSCRLTLLRPGLGERTYTWADADVPATEEHRTLPIRLDGEQIGALALDRAALAVWHTRRRRLLADIAEHLGAILQLSRLGIERERQLRAALAHAEDIAVSRRELVAEMDRERRSIERNLHDGAQHHLVSLGMALGLAEHELTCGQLAAARDRLAGLATQIDVAEAMLVQTATGVSTTLLAERGLATALHADFSGAHPPVAVRVPDTRFPPEVEAGVYFCCLEAVNNAGKYAPGAAVEVHIGEVAGTLHFTVRDQGPGFASPAEPTGAQGRLDGRGLRNVVARIAALGGTVSIHSVPGGGTTIEGSVPLPREQTLLERVRELLGAAGELYQGSAQRAQLRELRVRLDARAAGPRQARDVLRELDALLHSAPPSGGRATQLRYQLEQVLTGSAELTEIDLLDELRSGTVALSAPERRAAEELLGAAGAQPRARLGLSAEADLSQARQAAQRQLACWRRRASHPASPRAVRDAAEVLARTCVELLAQLDTE